MQKRKMGPQVNQRKLPENPEIGRTELVKVFNKLRELEVKSILRLYVEDRQSPSHSDAAIEKALQGRESTAEGSGVTSSRPIAVETW